MKRFLAFLLALTLLAPTTAWAPTQVNPAGSASVGTALGGGGGTSSAGKTWLLSQPQSFNPFVRSNGASANNPVFCAFIDDVTIECFAAQVNAVAMWRSTNAGQSFTAISESVSLFGASSLNAVVRLPTGTYLFMSGAITPNSPFWLGSDGTNFVQQTATGLPAQPMKSPAFNGTTMLAAANGVGVAHPTQCRNTNSGSGNWACALMNIPTYPGAGFFALISNIQAYATPSTGVWLVVGNDSVSTSLRILRSTDDGVTWTQVFDTGIASTTLQGIACINPTTCLIADGPRILRSTNAGTTWTTVVSAAGASPALTAIIPFDSLTAVAVSIPGTAITPAYRTVDGGVTWTIVDMPACPQAGTTGNQQSTGIARNGRGFTSGLWGSLTFGGPCAYYSPLGTGGIAITGPIGVPLNVSALGEAPVNQGEGITDSSKAPWTVTTAQRPTLFNSSTTGAANTSVPITIAAVANQRAHVYVIEAYCSAGTSAATSTITDGGTTIWLLAVAAIPTAPAVIRKEWPVGLTGSLNSAVVITASACGVGNTTTLNVQADRF